MKNLLIILSLVISASPAFATRARLYSLGENGYTGSYYVNDNRDIFLDPAAINQYKKKLWLETGTASTAVDSVGAPKTEGGFTNTFGDFVYGVYVGRTSNRMLNAVATVNGAGGNVLAPDHAFDFFFGGEASSVKYGIDVVYAGAQNRAGAANVTPTSQTASLFAVKLGADINAFKVFTSIGITSDSKTDANNPATLQELKGNLSLDVGATYAMDDMTYLAKFSTFSSDYTVGTTLPTINTGKTMAFAIGSGWKHEASKSVTMYSRIQFDYQKDTTDTTVGAAPVVNTVNNVWYNVPVVLAAEAQATSWLTIRGAVSHSLLGQHVAGLTKDSINNMTTVAAGLGFNFGDLTIDALFGQSAALGQAGSESSQGSSQSTDKFGFGNGFASNVAMTYNF